MNFKEMSEKIVLDQSKRATRRAWNSKTEWVCLANGVVNIPTSAIWNRHTKKQSLKYLRRMNLKPYFIMCVDDEIYYGLDSLSDEDKKADDWEII